MRVGDRTMLVVTAAAVGLAVVSPSAAAQRKPVVAHAAPYHAPAQPTVPYPGATVTIDPSVYGRPQRFSRQFSSQQRRFYGTARTARQPVVYLIPVPADGYGAYGGPSSFGGVTDANGQPLYMSGAGSGAYGMGTPSLTGAPYQVGDGGAMTVDFGNGDRRTIPSCAALAAAQDPEGRARTIFYEPPADGLVLRTGQSGRVAGEPPAGAPSCYTADPNGRVVLDY
jgi:hypothetical protein